MIFELGERSSGLVTMAAAGFVALGLIFCSVCLVSRRKVYRQNFVQGDPISVTIANLIFVAMAGFEHN